MNRLLRRLRSAVRRRPLALVVTLALLPLAPAGFMIGKAMKPAVVRLATAPRKVIKAPPRQASASSPRRPAGPPAPAALQQRLEALAARYHEPVGLAVADVTRGWVAEVNGHSVLPQQSVSKTWVALAALDAIDRGRLRLDQEVVMGPDDRSVFYEPIAGRLRRGGYRTTVGELLQRAMEQSDNAANDKLIGLMGGAKAVGTTLAAKGLKEIRVGSSERDLQAHIAGMGPWTPAVSGWKFKEARALLPDQVRQLALDHYLSDPDDGASPVGIVQGLKALKRGELVSDQSTDLLLSFMENCKTGRKRLRAGLPGGWTIGDKTGTGPDWQGASAGINDIGVITAPDGRAYTVAVMIPNTKQPESVRHRLFREVAASVVDVWEKER